MGDTDRSRPEDGLGGGVAPEPLNTKPAGLKSDAALIHEGLMERCEPGGSLWAHGVHEAYGAGFDPDCPVCVGVLRGAAAFYANAALAGVVPEPEMEPAPVTCRCGCRRELPAGFGDDHRVVDILRNLYPAQLDFLNRVERELKLRIPRGL